MAPPHRLRALLAILSLSASASAFSLPGVAPTSYHSGELVPLQVGHVSPSSSDQNPHIRSVLSFDYYKPEFHFCRPGSDNANDGAIPSPAPASIGSVLFGGQTWSSPFELKMGVNESCKAACGPRSFSQADAAFVNDRIKQDYAVNLFVDGLPAGQLRRETTTGKIFQFPGFPLGRMSAHGLPTLHNHYDIVVDFHPVGKDQFRVVGAVVQPSSLGHNRVLDDGSAFCVFTDGDDDDGDEALAVLLPEGNDTTTETTTTTVSYTYSVYWRESETPFAARWDRYLHVYDPPIHWLGIANSSLVLALLVGMAVAILYRNLRRDIVRYHRIDDGPLDDVTGMCLGEDGYHEDSGWKLVHGDVFRPPGNPLPLSVLVGNGVQLGLMGAVTIAVSALGVVSPSSRGGLATAMLVLYTVFSFVGGFVSTRLYRFFHGPSTGLNVVLTPVGLPLVVFTLCFILNLVVWGRHASGAVPFGTMVSLVAIWLVTTVPLSLLGSWLALRQQPIAEPTKTNPIPRQIPPYRGWMTPSITMVLLGILPFGAIFVELYFILSSIWFSRIYYMFGFLLLAFGIMGLTCAAVTVLFVYLVLCSENYHWQWPAFFAAGSSGLYVFLYAIYFWFRTLDLSTWTSAILYLGYSAVISLLVAVLAGSIGFLASWLLVMKIYETVKAE